jgi:hypothetical protein
MNITQRIERKSIMLTYILIAIAVVVGLGIIRFIETEGLLFSGGSPA